MNIDIKEGYLVEDAELFITRSGNTKVTFRLRVPRDNLPPKEAPPRHADFFSVVAYGRGWTRMLEKLKAGAKVLVIGHSQSRDLPNGRVVVETVAAEIRVLQDTRGGDGD